MSTETKSKYSIVEKLFLKLNETCVHKLLNEENSDIECNTQCNGRLDLEIELNNSLALLSALVSDFLR